MRPYVVFIIEKNAPPLSGGSFQWPVFCTSLVIQKISQTIDQYVFIVSKVRKRKCDVFVVGEFMFFFVLFALLKDKCRYLLIQFLFSMLHLSRKKAVYG